MIRVASYNLLADAYVRAAYYPRVPPALLAPGARTAAIASRLSSLSADVACLQEVEAHVAVAVGAGHLALKPGKPEGPAVLTRLPALRSLALPSASLVELAAEGLRTGFASCHLAWAPPGTPAAAHPGVAQARAVLASLWDCDAWVVCGDLNATAGSDVVKTFTSAGFLDVGPRGATCVANGAARRIDFILVRAPHLEVRAEPAPLPGIEDSTSLPSADEPSDHLPIAAALRFVAPL